MSLYIAVELDDKTKQLLSEKQLILKQNCKGDIEDPTRFHITIDFLGNDTQNIDLVIEAMKQVDKECNFKKIDAIAKNFYTFNNNSVVSWIGVENSFDLYKIKYALREAYEKVGYNPPKDKHDGYTPHITMAYNFECNDNISKEFDGIPFIIDNVSLWNGFKCNDEYIHNKIFGINLK